MTQLTHYTYSKRCVVIDHRNRGLEPSQPISIMGREIRSPAPSQHAAADLCLHGSGENENAEKSSPRFSSPPAAVPVGLETMGAITVSCSQPSPPHHQGPSPRRAPEAAMGDIDCQTRRSPCVDLVLVDRAATLNFCQRSVRPACQFLSKVIINALRQLNV